MLWEPVFLWEFHLWDKLQLADIIYNKESATEILTQSQSYLELNDKLSLFIRTSVNWHSLILNTSDITVLYDFTC